MKIRYWGILGCLFSCHGGATDPENNSVESAQVPAYSSTTPRSAEATDELATAESTASRAGDIDTANGESSVQEAAELAQRDADQEPNEAAASANDPTSNDEPNTSGEEDINVVPPAALNRILVFTRTEDFRHDSIPAGIQAFRTLGVNNEFSVEQTEIATDFNDANLAQFDVVVWLNTTQNVLDDVEQLAFERYIQAGGGWVGVHAAADTEKNWPWYGDLVGGGAWFLNHPNGTPTATLLVDSANTVHGSIDHLPSEFEMVDEWYNFQANPRPSVTVLLRLDEGSYNPDDGVQGAMGSDHPIAWYHEFDGGRAWYTGLGHRIEQYEDPRFTRHLLGGLRWAAGLTP